MSMSLNWKNCKTTKKAEDVTNIVNECFAGADVDISDTALIVKPQKKKAEDVTNFVKECFAGADVDIPDTVLDRAHRIGPVYKDESDQDIQGIIVKFNNFRYRSMFYKNRKKLKRGKHVRINLTSNRYNLLKKTNALIKHIKMENTVYSFADVNCRLQVVGMENGEGTFFDDLEEVDLFLSQT